MSKTAVSGRWILAAVCVLTVVSVLLYIMLLFHMTPVQVKLTNYDAYRTETLKMIHEEASSFFEIGVLVLGALWGAMIVSKENRLSRKDVPEIVMFCATNFLLVMFLYFNWKYGRLLAQLYWDMGPLLSTRGEFADVMNSRYVLIHHLAVSICFYGGLIMSALSTLSNSMLRRRP